MSLKSVCMKNMVQVIKNLPPQLQEELLGKSKTQMEQEIEQRKTKKLNDEIQYYSYMIEEMVRCSITKSKPVISYNHVSDKIRRMCAETVENIENIIEPVIMDFEMKLQKRTWETDDSDTSNDYFDYDSY